MAGIAEDVDTLVKHLMDICKDRHVTKNDLVHPTREFMVEFYEKYLLALDEKLAVMSNDDENYILGNITDLCKDIDPVLGLYMYVSNLGKQLYMQYFKLSDLSLPTHRSLFTIKMFINFLLYVRNNLAAGKKVADGIKEHVAECYQMPDEIDELKIKVSTLSYEIGESEEKLDEANIEYQKERKATLELQDAKAVDDIEKKKLEGEVNTIWEKIHQKDQYLKTCNDEILEQSQIVEEDEYIGLEANKSNLEAKLLELRDNAENYQDALESKKIHLQHLDDLVKLVETIDFSTLEVVAVLEEKIRAIENGSSPTKMGELKALIVEENKKNMKITEEIYSQKIKYKTIIKSINEEETSLGKKIKQEKANRNQMLEKVIAEENDLQQQCTMVEREIVHVKDAENATYKKMLENENLLNTSFAKKLRDLKKLWGP